jgi:7,8-dihydropterin-6-yl-methyl-4-(beta-D-ribofuranosyl)aminobenzene 5'-phosphate synthase
MNKEEKIRLTIVYDNHPIKEGIESDWGFSCFIEGVEKNILFDTGRSGDILLSNMEKLGIQPYGIDLVFLSHAHKDHTEGLPALLTKNSKIAVWLPDFFSPSYKKSITSAGAQIVEVDNFRKICEKAYTTGVIQGWIKEQSLILDTSNGLIVVTGCAHPRIVKIVSTAKELMGKNVHMVVGGFHLAGFTETEIGEITAKFRELDVEKVAPCHCSGDLCRTIMSGEYAVNFIETGVGKEIVVQ